MTLIAKSESETRQTQNGIHNFGQCNIYLCCCCKIETKIQSTLDGETETPKIFTKFVALTSNKMLKMSQTQRATI